MDTGTIRATEDEALQFHSNGRPCKLSIAPTKLNIDNILSQRVRLKKLGDARLQTGDISVAAATMTGRRQPRAVRQVVFRCDALRQLDLSVAL